MSLYPRLTKADKRSRREKLEAFIKELEGGKLDLNEKFPELKEEQQLAIKDYREFLSFSPEQQKMLRDDWSKYFEDVKNSKAALRYRKMRSIYMTAPAKTINEYADKAREQRKNQEWGFSKPYGRYPIEYVKCDVYAKYEYLKDELKKLMSQGESDAMDAFL